MHNHEHVQDHDIKKEVKSLLSVSLSGSAATVIQIGSLMWMRTIMNYQYYHGGTFRSTFTTLYKEGGIRRLYKGFGVSLLYVPMCRFGDIMTNIGTIQYMNNDERTKNWSLSTKTFCGTLLAGIWRISILPIDTLKITLQVDGNKGMQTLKNKISTYGLASLYRGSGATFVACVSRDYPWFATYNYLNLYFDTNHKDLSKSQTIMKNAFTGLTASMVTDMTTNSLQVVKTIRQTQTEKIGYGEVVRSIVKKDGISGLFGRGLKTRLMSNGIQGMMFSVIWKFLIQ